MDNSIKIEFPNSKKIYMQGKLFPEIKVGMRQVTLTPTVRIVDGKREMEQNAPVTVYDTSGPFGDANMEVDLKKGLPRMRESWIE